HLSRSTLFPYTTLFRSDIPVAFSRGYNPQPKTAFAMPLPVGMTSEGEYMDIILDSHLCPEIFCQRMNDALPDGIMLLKAVEVGRSEEHTSELQSRENIV